MNTGTETTGIATATLARLDHVSRRFGEATALDDVSLDIREGEILGLLGPNGAGKSTLLSLLQGRRAATSGTVSLFGADPRRPASRTALGSTPQETALPDVLRVQEVVDLVAAHFPAQEATADLAQEFGFADLLRRQCGSLSGGQRRRVSVALAFVGRPRLVLLDEPTTGLDVDARRALWGAIRRRRDQDGIAIVVTSHYLEEIEALADRVVVVSSGRVLVDDRLDAVRSRVGSGVLQFRSDAATDRLLTIAGSGRVDVGERAGAGGIGVTAPRDRLVTLTVPDPDAAVLRLAVADIDFRDLTVRGATLEEAFLALTDATALASAGPASGSAQPAPTLSNGTSE